VSAQAPAPELREVRGPSALGGGWHRSRDLLYLMASTEFKRTYFNTALGYVWSVGRPLMLFGVLLVVFSEGLKLGSLVPHYPVLLLLNIVLFAFFQEATGTAVTSIVSAEAIVRKTQFPRLVIPLSVVCTALINVLLNLVVVFVFILGFGISPRWTWLLFPVLLGGLVIFSTAIAMILSSLYPRYRDLGIIWTVASTALFYASPVIYVLDRFHSHTLRVVMSANPITPILEAARKWIIDPSAHGPAAQLGSYTWLLIPAAIYVVTCVAAVLVFRREAPRIAESL
jgi:ABC-2 type transport system permease protein